MIIIIVLSLFLKNINKIENFTPWHYKSRHYVPLRINSYRMDYIPPIILPPNYGDLGVTDFSHNNRIPIGNSSAYCKTNPYCYPCPGWRFIGPPNCI